ncbi:hypothetical protein BDZ45DRAFT_693689 [Acephala macrosclerotiorum]|nr:hypothetical protein BDZ45DRAFT_693689 [Acephala macrosclerotiorum]
MPRTRKCQACRSSKKLCLRDGGDWNEQDFQTRCSRCKNLSLCCGPDEYKDENDQGEREVILGIGQRAGATDNRGVQPLAPAPYTEAYLRRRLRELSNSESFRTTRQNIRSFEHGLLQGFTVPEDLSRTLEDIKELAGQAYASNDLSIAELAFLTLIDWYDDLGLEFQQLREELLMKVGGIFETTEWKVHAEKCSLKIFDYLLVAPPDIKTPFHHAIRNFKKKGPVGQDALMRIIRCCPLIQFRLRNEEGQTPLWLAVYTKEEEVVLAMIKRLRDPERQFRIDPIILDATDPRGLTILTTAILAQFSLPLIDALILCGFKVNPPTWQGGPPTPLQAASTPGYERPDVAWLLLRHQANLGDVRPDSNIAVLLANGLLPEPAYVPLLPKLDQQP